MRARVLAHLHTRVASRVVQRAGVGNQAGVLQQEAGEQTHAPRGILLAVRGSDTIHMAPQRSPQRLQTTRFYPYDIPEMGKLQKGHRQS